jgi:hypothetical protein
MRSIFTTTILFILLASSNLFSQTGKIQGYVRDAATDEPLIGVNVLIEGTNMGAATNLEGFYAILNVRPGTYSVRASSIGYTATTLSNVEVNTGLTTEADFRLSDETITTEEVVVVAQRPVIQKDVSSNIINITAQEIENLPVTSITSVIGLQAGVLSGAEGPIIRGGGADQTAFVVNGITLRDERNNTPYTGISYTSVQEIQVQTGGFNAEYGNIRSGVINVVTKEGSKDKYNFSFIGRYRPTGPKHFGDSPYSSNSYWIRPYIDPDVAWTGTQSGAWDEYTKAQYQEFRGWNKVSEELLTNDNPNDDLTPEAAQKLFLWQHRRQAAVNRPDYDLDMNLNGPIPGGRSLGNLRFALSGRSIEEMYFIPLSRDSYRESNYSLRLTSDISQGMKLSVDGMIGEQSGTSASRSGGPGLFRSSSGIASQLDIRSGASFLDSRVFATDYWAPSNVKSNMQAAKLTHVLNNETFYEVLISRLSFRYDTGFGYVRDTSRVYQFGDAFFDEAPYGVVFSASQAGIGSAMNMGYGFSNSRDTSKLTTWTGKLDLSSQLDRYNFVKAGVEFVYTDNNVNYALIDSVLPTNNARSVWQTYPIRGGLYIQDKLEFEGMIANLGVRFDYSDPGAEWYELDPFDRALSGALSGGLDTLVAKVPVKKQFDISPRLGVAFPISVNSKLFFNYGHSRSMPLPEQLFLVRRNMASNLIERIADPTNPLQKTIQYELGYEHSLFDQYLIRVMGYYKDISDETRLVTYTNRNSSVNYSIPEPNRYQDTRGFEVTLNKNRGEWLRGFVNYTYEVTTAGFFGLPRYYENPALQRDVERNTAAFEQSKPVPRPYARANVDFFTPSEFGPELGGLHVLGDWVINLIGTWRSGTYFSWTGPGATKPGYQNNIQWKDFYNFNMRFSKGFDFGIVRMDMFIDVNNLLNNKYMDFQAGFVDGNDWNAYMASLHLPDDIVGEFSYGNIPGNDKPGDVRSGPYIPWDENASESQKEEWRNNKSYIDMPNLPYAAFLNPRDIYWGLKFSINL